MHLAVQGLEGGFLGHEADVLLLFLFLTLHEVDGQLLLYSSRLLAHDLEILLHDLLIGLGDLGEFHLLGVSLDNRIQTEIGLLILISSAADLEPGRPESINFLEVGVEPEMLLGLLAPHPVLGVLLQQPRDQILHNRLQ